jgi:hypothetical protein
MLRTRQIQDCVIDGNEEIFGWSAKFSGERRFAQVFDNVIAHQPPKLTRRNPDIASATDDLCRAFTGAGHSSPPFLMRPDGNLLLKGKNRLKLFERIETFLEERRSILNS